MNLKKKLILYVLAVIGTAALILVVFGILNKAGYNNLVEILVAVAAVISLLLKLRGKPSDLTMIQYKETYAEFVKGAFENDKKSYKKLIEACAYFGESKFDKAHKLLDKLLEKCTCTRDYQVVYNVKAICYAKEGRDEPLVEIYKKLLQYDIADTQTWSNLGWTYLKMGKTKDAGEAFETAIKYDMQNPILYNNMATYYIKTAEPAMALECAQKAMELAPDVYQPYSAAVLACRMLGDEEGVAKYSRLYVEKGGDASKMQGLINM